MKDTTVRKSQSCSRFQRALENRQYIADLLNYNEGSRMFVILGLQDIHLKKGSDKMEVVQGTVMTEVAGVERKCFISLSDLR